jgi:hypothetical protein
MAVKEKASHLILLARSWLAASEIAPEGKNGA